MTAEKEEWLYKHEAETDERFGKRPNDRTIEELVSSCVINVDKHSGPTSHQVTAWAAKILEEKKSGHAGTLDPAVTGVLPIALGNATKAMPVLMGIDKEYIGVLRLHKEVPEGLLREAFSKFVGTITQTPPIKSAVSRRPRDRDIYQLDILEISDDRRDVLFHTRCQAGTYIRKLCHDIGQALGVGGHMTELRRIRAGNFHEKDAVPLVDIKDAHVFWKEDGEQKALRKILTPVEYAILHVKRVFIKDSTIHAITNGAPLYAAGISRIQKGIVRGETIAMYSLKDELVALGISKMTSEEMLNAKRGTAARTDRVLIDKGVYPKGI